MADAADDEPDRPALDAAQDDAGSLVEQLKDLAADVRTAVEAEAAWQGERAGFVAGRSSGIALWAGLALVCAFIALLALAFGAILALVPVIGAVLATLLVTGVLLLGAVAAATIARGRFRALKAAAFPAKPDARP
jgi:hypothetical protein